MIVKDGRGLIAKKIFSESGPHFSIWLCGDPTEEDNLFVEATDKISMFNAASAIKCNTIPYVNKSTTLIPGADTFYTGASFYKGMLLKEDAELGYVSKVSCKLDNGTITDIPLYFLRNPVFTTAGVLGENNYSKYVSSTSPTALLQCYNGDTSMHLVIIKYTSDIIVPIYSTVAFIKHPNNTLFKLSIGDIINQNSKIIKNSVVNGVTYTEDTVLSSSIILNNDNYKFTSDSNLKVTHSAVDNKTWFLSISESDNAATITYINNETTEFTVSDIFISQDDVNDVPTGSNSPMTQLISMFNINTTEIKNNLLVGSEAPIVKSFTNNQYPIDSDITTVRYFIPGQNESFNTLTPYPYLIGSGDYIKNRIYDNTGKLKQEASYIDLDENKLVATVYIQAMGGAVPIKVTNVCLTYKDADNANVLFSRELIPPFVSRDGHNVYSKLEIQL